MAPVRRKIFRGVFYLTFAICLAGSLLLALQTLLPGWVESRLIPAMSRRMGIADVDGRVRRVGPFGVDAGPFRVGPADGPALAIDALQVTCTPRELIRGRLGQVRLSGVTVYGIWQNGGVVFPGLDRKAAGRRPTAVADSMTAGFPADRIEVRSAVFVLQGNVAQYRIPFEIDLLPDGQTPGNLKGLLRLYPRGQQLSLAVRMTWDAKKRTLLRFNGEGLELRRFADIEGLAPGLALWGRVDIQGQAVVNLAPFSMEDLTVAVIWKNGGAEFGSLKIKPDIVSDKGFEPLTIHLKKEKTAPWHLAMKGFRLDGPVPMNQVGVDLHLDRGKSGFTAAGRVQAEIAGLPGHAMLAIPVGTDWNLRATLDPEGAWTAGISGRPRASSQRFQVTAGSATLEGGGLQVTVTAKGGPNQGHADWILSFSGVKARAADVRLDCPAARAEGRTAFQQSEKGLAVEGTARVEMPGTRIRSHTLEAELPRLFLSGTVRQNGTAAPAFSGILQFSEADLRLSGGGTRLKHAAGRLPLHWPVGGPGKEGVFSIAAIDAGGVSMGSLKGAFRQEDFGAVFSAVHKNRPVPGMNLFLSGKMGRDNHGQPFFRTEFRVPGVDLPEGFDLGVLAAGARNTVLSGRLSAGGRINGGVSGIHGSAEVVFKDGVFEMAARRLRIEGIDTTLSFPALPFLRSGPGQQLHFHRAAMGDIVIDGGRIDYQVESAGSLLVEKSSFAWCGGNMDTQSLRISPGVDVYHLTLYCDRLKLARLLDQLGAADADGQGAVNGRIPLEYDNGEIRFRDGFLYSTPGDGGRIKLSGTEAFTAGLPADTPQFAQLDLAREALKDYEYKWARLGLVSDEGTLLVQLQFDGKPVGPLPFVYKKELGGFARVDARSQGSLFQGIRLDVNLRLPLNRILQYKDISGMLE